MGCWEGSFCRGASSRPHASAGVGAGASAPRKNSKDIGASSADARRPRHGPAHLGQTLCRSDATSRPARRPGRGREPRWDSQWPRVWDQSLTAQERREVCPPHRVPRSALGTSPNEPPCTPGGVRRAPHTPQGTAGGFPPLPPSPGALQPGAQSRARRSVL